MSQKEAFRFDALFGSQLLNIRCTNRESEKHMHRCITIGQRQSTYETVHVQRAFTSRCTLYVTAVPGACPKTAAVTLWSAHCLSH